MKNKISLRVLLFPLAFVLLSAGMQNSGPFPELERYKLKNGLEVIFADYGELPVTSLSFFVNVGKKSETPGQQGLSSLTANALLLGSEKFKRTEQDRILNRTGGSFGVSSNENFTLVSAQFLNKDIAEGMDLVSNALLKPAFPQQDMDEEKSFELSQNKPAKMDIGVLADIYGDNFAYGAAHPLGRHYYAAQYQKLTLAQVKEFYGFNFTPGNTKLVITGKPDHEAMKALIEKYFGSWTAAYGEVNGASYDIPPIKTKAYAFVPKEGAMQCCIEWFKKAPDAGSKDMAAFELANAVFSNHLGKEIREKDGFTYGIYSRYSETQNDGLFRIKTQVRTEVTQATMVAFDVVLADFYAKGATEAELKKFKTMLKVDILSVEEPGDVAALINPWVYRDYAKRKMYLAEIDAVDLAALNKAIKKYFAPDAYKVIVAGDAGIVNTQLQTLPNLEKLELNSIERDQ